MWFWWFLFVCNLIVPFIMIGAGRFMWKESSISDWKKKRTNPSSDKILIICEVLGVTPYELLSGAEHIGHRSRENMTFVIDKGTELGILVESYQQLEGSMQKKLLGYMEALKDMQKKE